MFSQYAIHRRYTRPEYIKPVIWPISAYCTLQCSILYANTLATMRRLYSATGVSESMKGRALLICLSGTCMQTICRLFLRSSSGVHRISLSWVRTVTRSTGATVGELTSLIPLPRRVLIFLALFSTYHHFDGEGWETIPRWCILHKVSFQWLTNAR